jgi:S-adenosylmethionine/arginine decarboxylase-like enzyme
MKTRPAQIIKHYVGLVTTKPFVNSFKETEKLAQAIIDHLQLSVIKKFSHRFFPQGISLVYILSESHLAIHTWPELGIIHIDLVVCSYRSRAQFAKSLKQALAVYRPHSLKIKSVDF